MHFKKLTALAALTVLMSGCASMAVTNDSLTQRTATALGLTPSQFTISNRTDNGVRTDYSVQTTSGKTYACYVTGTVSITGRVVSDAVCSAPNQGAASAEASRSAPSTSCNALLKAAGKCQ